jgi:hypothetical protein
MVTSLSCDCPSRQYYSVLRVILILLRNLGPNRNSNTNSNVQPSSSPALPLPQCLPTVQSSVQQPVKRKAPPPTSLPSKRGFFDLAQLPSDLGELIARDTALLQRLGWRGLVAHRRLSSNFAYLDNLHHPARRLLHLYAHRGAPVKFAMPPWNHQHLQRALSRGLHRSSLEYIDFLHEEFVDMINKGQWVILPAKAVLHLPGL